MNFSEKHFQILETLDSQEISSQRQLAESTRISLGLINYALNQLLSKDLVKTSNFRENPHKISHVYF
jgi:TFIIE alpha subunit.